VWIVVELRCSSNREDVRTMQIFAELRWATVVVGHYVLESSPGWFHCLPLAYNCPRNIARGWTMGGIAVVSTSLGVHLSVDAVNIN
jgi:hypothetical protein